MSSTAATGSMTSSGCRQSASVSVWRKGRGGQRTLLSAADEALYEVKTAPVAGRSAFVGECTRREIS